MENLIDLHTHSVLSTHAYSSLTENIDAALKRGLKYYGISEHQPDNCGIGVHRFAVHNLRIVPRDIDGMKFLAGLEFNILNDGTLDVDKIRTEYLDYGIASIHSYKFTQHSKEETTNAYLKVLDNNLINIIGHLDDGHYECDFEPIVKKAKELHKLIEINNTSLKPSTNRKNTRENLKEIIKLCIKYKEPVIINSDAHIRYHVGEYELAYELLKEMNFPQDMILNFNEDLIKEYFYQER